MRRMLRGGLTITAAIAAATALGSWWALPIIAFAAGVGTPTGTRQAGIIGGCGGLAWTVILALQAAGGAPIGLAATKVGEVFRLPGPLFLALVPAFAVALGWGCAALGEDIGARLRRRGAVAVPAAGAS